MVTKLKVLCLHGYRQNLERFRSQTGSLRKILKNEVEFTFISAPHALYWGEGEERTWWFTREHTFSSQDETDQDTGFEESVKLIVKTFHENGPFDGLLGFSQGAALVGILGALIQRQEIDIHPKFVIIVSGFKSKCDKHLHYYMDKINIPSLHVIGETDQIIAKELSIDLANVFVDPVIIFHSGGHYVPGRSSFKNQYLEFVTRHMPSAIGDS